MKRPGDINRNGQQLLRASDERGTDHNALIWILKCRNCLNIYGLSKRVGIIPESVASVHPASSHP
jgi:hypothetical protein